MAKNIDLETWKKEHRMTPELLTGIIRHNSQCVHDQEHRCPLIQFVQVMCWEINQAMGVANEEDRGFKRYSDMLAARPLNPERFERGEE